MSDSEMAHLGPRLRQVRLERDLTVRGLAREVGVSASMISQIETAKVSPSVSTLYAITTALGITVEELFAQDGEPTATPVTGQDAPAEPRKRLGPLVRPEQRRELRLDSGVTWELLGELPHRSVDFLRITYAPGGTSSSGGMLMRHGGSEYGHLLSGELVLTLGFEQLTLRAGDSISFDSTTPHRYRNEGTEPAVGIWFVIDEAL
jgi:transcriptional regulator with XRE-family HTH domain